MYCSKCGADIKEGAKFCPKCGHATGTLPLTHTETPSPTKTRKPLNKKKVGITILIFILVSISALSLFYFTSSKKIDDGLKAVKGFVVSGDFERAKNLVEELERSNRFISPLHGVDFEIINEFLEEHRLCVLNEYPTYSSHSGIAGCVFWSRHNDLEKREVWISEFKKQEDQNYCQERYDNSKPLNLDTFKKLNDFYAGKYSDPKCEYEAFKNKKRQENWDYLVSEQWDEFTEHCALESCPLPDEINF